MKRNDTSAAVAARQDETPNRLMRVLAITGFVIALFWSVTAYGGAGVPQGEDPPGADGANGDGVTPPPEEGVITPPDVGDEDINKAAPDPDPGTTPVIPPEQIPEQPKQDK